MLVLRRRAASYGMVFRTATTSGRSLRRASATHPSRSRLQPDPAGLQPRPLSPFLVERFPGWSAPGVESLSSSECEPLRMRDLLALADDDAARRWDALSLGYPACNEGSAFLRDAIAAQYGDGRGGAATPREPVVNVLAPQEGIYLAQRALLSPGDHVVVAAPCYQSLFEVRLDGCGTARRMISSLHHSDGPEPPLFDAALVIRRGTEDGWVSAASPLSTLSAASPLSTLHHY